MNRRRFLKAVGLGAVSLAAPSCTPGTEKRTTVSELPTRPNFVFFLIDDMGWRDLGCYGSKFHETPNIDRLAGQGARMGRPAAKETSQLSTEMRQKMSAIIDSGTQVLRKKAK